MGLIRRVTDAMTDRLVPRTKAGACPACYSPGGCGNGMMRWCCYYGSGCTIHCGCT